MKVIITGATGLVGEGVMLECLNNEKVSSVLMVNRRHFELTHPKLKECIISDFMKLDGFENELSGYDACFFCAGISSNGMSEAEYTHITFDVTTNFAKKLLSLNANMTFNYVSGGLTDTSEQGKMMWARVKGRTENTLKRMGFKGQYNYRPGYMKTMPGQQNVKFIFKIVNVLYPALIKIFPSYGGTVREVALSMIHVVEHGYPTNVLEVPDIRKSAAE